MNQLRHIEMRLIAHMSVFEVTQMNESWCDDVASVIRIDKMIGVFCKRAQ